MTSSAFAAMAAARPTGTAVPATGVSAGFLVPDELYNYQYDHRKHDSSD